MEAFFLNKHDNKVLEIKDISLISDLFIKRQIQESKSFPLINHQHLEKDGVVELFL
jgi:hypothetical protein